MSHEYLQPMTAMASMASCTCDWEIPKSNKACALWTPKTPV